jgi:hypothetical protein
LTWSQLSLPAIVSGLVLAMVPVGLRLRPVTLPSTVMVTLEEVRSQRTTCHCPSLTRTAPEDAVLLPAEPRNRQEIFPLGCWNLK